MEQKTKTSKIKKDLIEKVEETNKAVTLQKVIINRELKYIYPKECKDTLSRKAYRQKIRNSIKKMERNIGKIKGEERRIAKETLDVFLKEHVAIN